MDWFLYDNGLRHERVKLTHTFFQISCIALVLSLKTMTMKTFLALCACLKF